MNRKQLIDKYIEFFKSKGHSEVKNSSLVPENDSTVLFTTAGMHPLVPYLLGQAHSSGKRLVNVQRCIRTGDIEEVGDGCHHTFFEMLGNWSLGDYFKKEAIEFTFEFLVDVLKIPAERLGVSCFKGDNDASKDKESFEVWKGLGILEDKIIFLGKKDNWWGPAGEVGPCGPDTEIFYWSLDGKVPKKFDVEDKRWVEIGNNVLMEYVKNKDGKYEEAKQKNIDFGGGVERIVASLNGLDDNYLGDMWKPIIDEIEHLSGKKYEGNEKEMRIIADHIKASVFIIADGVVPSNTEQGYVLRRLIRRAVMNLRKLGFVDTDLIEPIAEKVFKIYEDYKYLNKDKRRILDEFNKEEERFDKTLERGLREFERMSSDKLISGKEAFLLFQSYGFPIEMTVELASEKKVKIDVKEFEKESKKHQVLSRSASEGRFKSGLVDNKGATVKLHTAAHLLAEALRKVLGKDVSQKGSNITSERLRFDFNFDRKLTDEEKKEVEDLVNEMIDKKLDVKKEEMSVKDAKKQGAQGVFDDRYDKNVFVYSIGEFSKEICAGPHVSNVGELGKFSIKKEESSSAGVRRIRGVLG